MNTNTYVSSYGGIGAGGLGNQLFYFGVVIEYGHKYNKIPIFFNNNLKEYPDHSMFLNSCLLYTSPSPRDRTRSRMPSSA